MSNSKTRKLVFAALCVALGLVLPQAFHMVPNAGTIFLPMHIPVLLSGFICGWPLGLAVGVVTPLLSSFVTGMPPAFILPSMMCELAVYGLVGGILFSRLRINPPVAGVYISLIGAMLAGRVVAGLVQVIFYGIRGEAILTWLAGVTITALPGIIIQIVLIPLVVQGLVLAKIIRRPAANA